MGVPEGDDDGVSEGDGVLVGELGASGSGYAVLDVE